MNNSQNLLEVDFTFAKEIYSASTPEIKQKIDDKYPGLFKQYKIGTFFELIDGQMNIFSTYILAQVETSKVALISLDGNRFNDPIEVNNVMNITQTEFDLICSNELKQYGPIEDLDGYLFNEFRLVDLNINIVSKY